MNFGGWHPVQDASTAAPPAAGVLQARADAVVPYPRGMSAMLFYGCCAADETLQGYLAASGDGAASLARAVAVGARWVRFGVSPQPEVEFARLMERFLDRFGATPLANDPGGAGVASGGGGGID